LCKFGDHRLDVATLGVVFVIDAKVALAILFDEVVGWLAFVHHAQHELPRLLVLANEELAILVRLEFSFRVFPADAAHEP